MSGQQSLAHGEELRELRERVRALERAEAGWKWTESLLAGRNRVLECLAAGAPLEEILSLLVQLAEQIEPELIGSVLLLDRANGRLRLGAAPSLPDFYNEAVDGIRVGPGVGCCGTAAHLGERVIVEDTASHPYWSEFRELADRAGIRACWSEPILSAGGEVLGTFAMYYRRPRRPGDSELELIHSFAQKAAIAIERKTRDQALATANFELEIRIRQRTQELSEANERLEREVAEKERAERAIEENAVQLLAAQKIQQRLLPGAAPSIPGYDIAGAVYPAEFAAGDLFDFLPMGDKCLGVVVGDVSGHGLGPSLLMASTHAYFHSLAKTQAEVPDILALVNSSLVAETEDDRFVTLLLARLDPQARTIVYANAGHPAGYVMNARGRIQAELKSQAVPLGILPEAQFPAADPVTLDPGDLVLLVTDGILEAASPEGEFFGARRMLDVVRAHRGRSAGEITEGLYAAARDFSGQEKPADDITAVVIKVETPR